MRTLLRSCMAAFLLGTIAVTSGCESSKTATPSLRATPSPRPHQTRTPVKDVILARARIETPDGDVEDAWSTESAFCTGMARIGTAAESSSSGNDIAVKQNNIEASLGAAHLPNGAQVDVLRHATISCTKGGLPTSLSLVLEPIHDRSQGMGQGALNLATIAETSNVR